MPIKTLKHYAGDTMILKKITCSILVMCFLNGCLQNTAFLGPIVTVASTGNVYQAGLSYGSSQVMKKMTGKISTENMKSFINKNYTAKEEEDSDEFFDLIKNTIEKKSKVLNLANQ